MLEMVRREVDAVAELMRPETVIAEDDALPSVVCPVTPSVPAKVPLPPVSVPIAAVLEKSAELDAVVEKSDVEVAKVI